MSPCENMPLLLNNDGDDKISNFTRSCAREV